MKKELELIAATVVILLCAWLSGCAAVDDYSRTQGMVPRAASNNIFIGGVDSGRLTDTGFNFSDANIVAYGYDVTEEARGKLLAYNKVSKGGAYTQIGISAIIAALALGGGPIIAAGGLAGTSLVAQHVFETIDSPAKAQAWSDFIKRNNSAFSAYLADLSAETCSTFISGKRATKAGITYAGALTTSENMRQAATQGAEPSLSDMQAVTAAASMTAAGRFSAMDVTQCPEQPPTEPTAALRSKPAAEPPTATIPKPQKEKPTARSMNRESLARFPKETKTP